METNKGYSSIFSRFPVLSWMGAFFCFIIFPFAIVDYGITSILSTKNESIKANTFKDMDDQLEFILNYANDSKYFHQILLNEFIAAKKSNNPEVKIAKSIKMLKKKYPNCFKFIVWNKNGKAIKSITDETGYRYIVQNLFKLFKQVSTSYYHDNGINIANISIVKKKINIFKNYLGKLLIPEHLKQPLLPKKIGTCVLSDTETKYPLFWFNYSKKISIFCAINKNALKKNYGAIDAIRLLKKHKGANFECGIVSMSKNVSIFPRMYPGPYKELIVEFGKFENSSLPHIESKNFLISFKLLTPSLRGFCLAKRDILLTNIDRLKKILLATMFKFLVPLILFLYCLKLRTKQIFISIKWKLAFLFLYANGLPLIILGVIGSEYLEQSKIKLLQDFHRQNITLVSELDRGFKNFLQKTTNDVTKKLKAYKQKYPIYAADKILKQPLSKLLNDLKALSIGIFNKKGEIIAYVSQNKNKTSKVLWKLIASSILQHANLSIKDISKVLHAKNTVAPIQLDPIKFAGKVYRLFNKVTDLSFVTTKSLAYMHLVFNPNKKEFHSTIIITFKPSSLHKRFIEKKIQFFNKSNSKKTLIALLVKQSQLLHGENPIFSIEQNKLTNQIQKATSFQIVKNNNFNIASIPYVLTEVAGKEMQNTVLTIGSPLASLVRVLQKAKLYAFVFLMFNIAISLTIIIMIAKQFIKPISNLGEAISEIGKHNFRFLTNISTNDELSELGTTLNSTIEGMSELEVGTIVQENLFPGNSFQDNKVEVYAKSVSMTKMGGDYYDFFKLGDGLTGIFMGDVAGHGIQAAMITAMIKASLIIQKKEKLVPSTLILNLHKMLYRIKSKKFRRMMTCQYFVIDQKTNKITITNAGHCYPVKIYQNGTKAEFLEVTGMPIGVMNRVKYTEMELNIDPGETLVLYSDGIVESHGKNGEEFGFNRFLNLLQDSWENNIEKFYNNIYSAYLNWSPEADDDITIVVIRYKRELNEPD